MEESLQNDAKELLPRGETKVLSITESPAEKEAQAMEKAVHDEPKQENINEENCDVKDMEQSLVNQNGDIEARRAITENSTEHHHVQHDENKEEALTSLPVMEKACIGEMLNSPDEAEQPKQNEIPRPAPPTSLELRKVPTSLLLKTTVSMDDASFTQAPEESCETHGTQAPRILTNDVSESKAFPAITAHAVV